MSSVDEGTIADFLKAAGRVSRLKESVRVTEGELLEYLASCGITANTHREITERICAKGSGSV